MRSLLKHLTRRAPEQQPAGEANRDYYNARFSEAAHWTEHYTRSTYYFIWTLLIDRLRRTAPNDVLEIGCGPGQLACAMHEAGVVRVYNGLDFSSVAISHARKACPPHFTFHEADALTSDLYDTAPYGTAVSTEFLEHVDGDLTVLGRLKPRSRVLATVPNFPYISHVRHFKDEAEVAARYAPLFIEDFTVTGIPGVQPQTRFFVIEGTKG